MRPHTSVTSPRPFSLTCAVVCLLLAPALTLAETTLVWESGGLGDHVGQGGSGTVTDADGVWVPLSDKNTYRDAVFRFDDEGEFSSLWRLTFGAASDAELVPGMYVDTGVTSSSSFPYVDISYDGRSCNSGSGDFTVSAIEQDVYGKPIRFVAEFSQHCQPDDPALIGTLDHTFDGTLGPASFSPGNFLVMYRNRLGWGEGNLYEYTTGGSEVQVLPLARPAGGPPAPFTLSRFNDTVRDVVMDAAGRVHVFIGEEDSWLGSFDPATGAWQYVEFPDWNVWLSDRVGAIAAFGDYVYATDDLVSGDATAASGIMRFDAASGLAAQRFAEDEQYVDLAAGFDGRLYALRESFSDTVDVYDPESMALLDTIALAQSVRGIAVNAQGELFGPVYSGTIYRFSQSGVILDSLATGVSGLFDIDLTRSGAIVLGRSDTFASPPGARVVVTDQALSSFTEINVDPDSTSYPHTFVAWAQPAPGSLFSAAGFESGDTSAWSGAVGAAAGLLDVTAAAAFDGGFGLEVTVGGMCTAESDPVITSPSVIEGTFVGCTSLTASGVQVGGGGATFAAGQRIVLGDGFSVATGAPFEATLDTGLLSGLAYLEDNSPEAATSYNASFELRLDDLTIGVDAGTSDTVQVFTGVSGSGTSQFRAIVKRDAADTEYRLVLEARRDDGTFVTTQPADEITLAAGWHELRFGWQAGEGDGFFFVTVDGGPPAGGLGSFDNGEQVLDAVRLGYVGGSAGSTTGTFDLDDFSSWM